MRKLTIIFLFFYVFVSCKEEKNKGNIVTYNYEELKPLLSKEDSQIYVVNFWATWCAPCVKELPAFEKLLANYKNKNVKVLLVSLDFPLQIESKLIPFIKEKELKSEIILLDDPDQDNWIPKINEKWSGAIPATLIYNAKKRMFYERSFSYEELEAEVHKFLN